MKQRAGTSVALVGVNGAGKTTLFKILSRRISADKGDIEYPSLRVPYTQGIASVYSTSDVPLEFTISQMSKIMECLYPLWSQNDFRYYLDQFELDSSAMLGSLSTGNLQKALLSCALSRNAEFLILDEPMSVLDPHSRRRVRELLRGYLQQRGASLLFSTHRYDDLPGLADELFLLRDCKVSNSLRVSSIVEKIQQSGGSETFESIIDEHRG